MGICPSECLHLQPSRPFLREAISGLLSLASHPECIPACLVIFPWISASNGMWFDPCEESGAACSFKAYPLRSREKIGLKLNIQTTKIMASGPITSWQIVREPMETMRDFIFGGSKITADGDYSHEIKMLVPWKKSYDKPRQHTKKKPAETLLHPQRSV